MSDFQKFLDDNLDKVYISSKVYTPSVNQTYDIYSDLRDELISLRKETGFTQKELANRCNLTQANISKLEKGISVPTVETLKKIADATGKRLVIKFEDLEGR